MKVPVKKLLLLINVCILLWLVFYNFLGNSNSDILSKHVLESKIERYSIKAEPKQASEIRPGDILLLSDNDLLDKMIKIVTRSPYNHVVGVVHSTQVIEILPWTTVRYENLQNYIGQADVFTCDRLSTDDRKKIVSYVTSKVGTSYDYNLLIWEATRYLLNWMWPYESKGNYICSTLWVDAYREVGIDLCPDVMFPSPGDLVNSEYLRKFRSCDQLP